MSLTKLPISMMADGTDGNIISFDASGNPVAVATGSSGQALTSAGAGSPPTFAAVATGFEFVESVTASTSSTISIGEGNVATGYDYILMSDLLDCSADQTTVFGLQFGTGAGPTYVTSGYQTSGVYCNNSTVTGARLTSQASINFCTTNINLVGAGANETLSLCCHIYSPASNRKTRAHLYVFGDGSSNEMLHATSYGELDADSIVTGFRLVPASGNFASGDVILMRRKIA